MTTQGLNLRLASITAMVSLYLRRSNVLSQEGVRRIWQWYRLERLWASRTTDGFSDKTSSGRKVLASVPPTQEV